MKTVMYIYTVDGKAVAMICDNQVIDVQEGYTVRVDQKDDDFVPYLHKPL